MPEARDRISRPVDIAALFARRRSAGVGILADEPEDGAELFRSPARQQQQQQQHATPAAARTFVRTPADFGATTRGGRGGGVASAPRIGSWRGRYINENSAVAGSARRGRGRGRSGVLPSWYPRTPLRDITVIARVRFFCFFFCSLTCLFCDEFFLLFFLRAFWELSLSFIFVFWLRFFFILFYFIFNFIFFVDWGLF